MTEIGNNIVWICGLIMAIWGVLGVIQKLIEIFRKPEKTQNERLSKLESELGEVKKTLDTYLTYFNNDKTRIDSIVKGSAVMQKALLALLSHSIDGNNTEEMKTARRQLQKYLTEKMMI